MNEAAVLPVDAGTLLRIMPLAKARIKTFLAPLNEAMAEFHIVTAPRVAAFLAQLAHESGQFRYVRELASGEAYDTGRLAARLGNTPEADGDGQRYKGRGLIQITGAANYRACGAALGLDLLAYPEILEQPSPACRSAAWFWHSRGLNAFADNDTEEAFRKTTAKINGGYNGWEDRKKYWLKARAALAPLLEESP